MNEFIRIEIELDTFAKCGRSAPIAYAKDMARVSHILNRDYAELVEDNGRYYYIIPSQDNNSRLQLWNLIDKKRAKGEFHSGDRRLVNRICGKARRDLKPEERLYIWAVKPVKSGYCGETAVFNSELEAAHYWDKIARQIYPFPAPVNFPTPEEKTARATEHFARGSISPIDFVDDLVEYFSKASETEFNKLPASCQLFINSQLATKLGRVGNV
jgi:hypothetical protein